MPSKVRILRISLFFASLVLSALALYVLGSVRSGSPLLPKPSQRIKTNFSAELAALVTQDLQNATEIGQAEPGVFGFSVAGTPPVQIAYFNSQGTVYRSANGTSVPVAQGVALSLEYLSDLNLVSVTIHPYSSESKESSPPPLFRGKVYLKKLKTPEPELTAWISSPTRGEKISGQVTIRGTAAGPGLAGYVLEYFHGSSLPSLIVSDSQQVSNNDNLGLWDTASVQDGSYTLRLRVVSRDGSQTVFSVPVVVKNQPGS